MTDLKTAAPAMAGIPASAIHRFLDRLDNYQVNMHSFLLMRHGLLVAEGYYAPYKADTLHRMFSVTKTLNAVAVGLLCEEGRLRLDDPVIRYFPDKVPENVHPWIAEMTIRNLLMMRTCHASTTYKYDLKKEWVESFFTTAPTHKPGTVFHYDTSAAHVLCVLAERLTGMPMLDYLKDKVLSKIGWSEHSYVLKNDFGDSQGGSGLMATSRDLLLLGKLLMQNGRWEGEQLLPKEYIGEMTSLLTPNALTGGVISEAQGYGYQLWRSRHDGFVCYGMGGQLAVCLPKQDMIFVTTADTQGCGGGNDLIYNSFYEEILPALDTCSYDKAEEAAALSLRSRLSELALTPLRDWCRAASDKPLNRSFLENNTCAAKIDGKSFSLAPNSSGFSHISLCFTDTEGCLNYTFKDTACTIPFGLNTCTPGIFPLYDIKCAASGMWLSEDTFYIKVHLLDACIGSVHMEFVFGKNDVTIFMKKIEETQFKEFAGHFYGSCD